MARWLDLKGHIEMLLESNSVQKVVLAALLALIGNGLVAADCRVCLRCFHFPLHLLFIGIDILQVCLPLFFLTLLLLLADVVTGLLLLFHALKLDFAGFGLNCLALQS